MPLTPTGAPLTQAAVTSIGGSDATTMDMNIVIPIIVVLAVLLSIITAGLVRRSRNNKRRAAAAAAAAAVTDATTVDANAQVVLQVQPETSA